MLNKIQVNLEMQIFTRDIAAAESGGSHHERHVPGMVNPRQHGQLYTYRVPSIHIDTVKPGQRAAVQFGKKKIYTALIARVHENPPKDYTAKFLLDILDSEPVINEKQLELWSWMAEYYCCTLGE